MLCDSNCWIFRIRDTPVFKSGSTTPSVFRPDWRPCVHLFLFETKTWVEEYNVQYVCAYMYLTVFDSRMMCYTVKQSPWRHSMNHPTNAPSGHLLAHFIHFPDKVDSYRSVVNVLVCTCVCMYLIVLVYSKARLRDDLLLFLVVTHGSPHVTFPFLCAFQGFFV